MSREEASAKVCEGVALACNMGADQITEDSKFGVDIIADSLKYMAISAMLGTKFETAPAYADVAGCETIGQIVDWVAERN